VKLLFCDDPPAQVAVEVAPFSISEKKSNLLITMNPRPNLSGIIQKDI